MRLHSSRVHRSSPNALNTPRSSSAVIRPSWSASKNSNVSLSSASSQAGAHAEPTRLSSSSMLTAASSPLAVAPHLAQHHRHLVPAAEPAEEGLQLLPRHDPVAVPVDEPERAGELRVAPPPPPAAEHAGRGQGLALVDGGEESSEEREEAVVPEPKDGGSERDPTERPFRDPNRCLGLPSLRALEESWRGDSGRGF
ncbi:hypothetical protein NL676_016981 [Syzygium grande]|nr:hypothetical protein NL676_016981 [Syzygium grande]